MRVICSTLLLLFFPVSDLLPQDTSCGIAWGPILNISGTNPFAFSPKIAAQGDTLHATWFGGGFRLPYTRSTNNGLTWEEPREMLTDSVAFPNEANDPWVIANDRHVYLVFTFSLFTGRVHIMKSSDGGQTWTYPTPINNELNTQRIWHVTLSGDTILVAYPRYGPRIVRSTDGGASWDTSLATVRFPVEFAGKRLHNIFETSIQSRFEIAYRQSSDLGDSWTDSILLSTPDHLDSDQRVLGVAPIDSTNAHIFSMWRDAKYGFGTLVGESILMRRSTDNGLTWQPETFMTEPGEPVGYNNDIAGQQISSFGNTVLATWTNDLTGHVNMRYSINAGDSWSEPCDVSLTRLSLVSSCVVSQMAIHVLFEGPDNGCQTCFGIYYRRGVILETSASEENNKPAAFRLFQNYPNPFNPSTTIRFKVQEPGFTTLKIFDVLGQEVAVLLNEKKDTGEYSVEWNAGGRASGIYVYRMTHMKSSAVISNQTKAMMYLK